MRYKKHFLALLFIGLGFIPLYNRTGFVSSAHYRVESTKIITITSDLFNTIQSPKSNADIAISSFYFLVCAFLILCVYAGKKMSFFVKLAPLLLFNAVAFIYITGPHNGTLFSLEVIPSFFVFIVLGVAFDVLCVFHFLHDSRDI
jgi:hypothetical protein